MHVLQLKKIAEFFQTTTECWENLKKTTVFLLTLSVDRIEMVQLQLYMCTLLE